MPAAMGSDRAGAFFKRSPAPRPSSDGAASSSSHQPTPTPAIYKYSGELDAATELLDRALYCLEAAWHPQFKRRAAPAASTSQSWRTRPGLPRLQMLIRAAAPAPPSYPSTASPLLGFEPNVVPPETAKLLLALDPDSDLMGSTSSFWSWWRRRRSRALRLVRAGAALSRREPPLFLPIALNSSAYALMRVARDGGAAPSTSRCPAPLRISSKTEARQVLRRLFSHTLDPPRRAAPPSAAALAAALLRQAVLMYPGAVRPLLENYNVKPDSGAPGLGRPTQAALFDDDEPAASVELPPLTAGIGPWTSSML
eukprot:tig00000215_g18621.t2